MSLLPICHAELDWIEQDGIAIPLSRQFGDVYFSRANGLAETRHVFLQGNDLAQRLGKLASHQYFCVGETGFGTGLNILALWQLWQHVRPDNHSRLHVVTFEKYPLACADLTRALKAWPELAPLSQKLLAQYPAALPGCHRMIFAQERLSIDLWLGDAADCLPQVTSQHAIDAWFLDGFAPKCNPELWQQHILQNIVRLSGPGTTFASFSVAGMVKQGLRDHGITVTRPAGFGKKREMLKAWWPLTTTDSTVATDYHSSGSALTIAATLPRIAIIGAGIAGLSLADALARRGLACDIHDKTQPLAGASGNPYALLAPKIVSLCKFTSSLPSLGWLHSVRYWQQFTGISERTGSLHVLQKDVDAELDKLQDYPVDIMQALNANQASALAGVPLSSPAVHIKPTVLLQPHALAKQILRHPLICYKMADIVQIKPHAPHWELLDQHGNRTLYDWVFVCTAWLAQELIDTPAMLRPVRGQLSWLHCKSGSLLPLTYGGYSAKIPNRDTVLLGASFVRGDSSTELRPAEHQHNLDLLQQVSPELASQLGDGIPGDTGWQGRASVRAQSPDYLPLAGQIATMPNVWTLTGLGSKGFSLAPLCAEMICAQLLNEVYPVTPQIIAAVQPDRFGKKTVKTN